MVTPQQVVESFLQEKAKAQGEARAYLKQVLPNYFDNTLLQYAERFLPKDTVEAVVEHVKQTHGRATAVTLQRLKSLDLRARYRLAAEGESWKIVGIDRMCVRCHGTGQFRDVKCERCNGEGFRDCTGSDFT